ncbi:Immunity protein Imm1 [Amycolatopsis arida]|uniref:Immunity protein Imm1 n=1 Tax=Amycolatopsis arida TaxID=587909 RepID=A0A1I5SRG1_9PSEU|nr:Imm1 family immunity protein [Amycolatopsis arida]TDX96378.1 immunity protein Imm1 of predicted polymorphic toxin system [Amycolatopsis arida]SFP73258.1 Immunity protein Imm1 [Amycolatopsis arida]
MTWTAYVSVYIEGSNRGQAVPLVIDEDVDRLIALLRRPEERDGSIQSEDATSVLDVQVEGDYGYLLFSGEDAHVVSIGDPVSPEAESEAGFPAGAGVPLDTFRKALHQFLATNGQRPTVVEWRDPLDRTDDAAH